MYLTEFKNLEDELIRDRIVCGTNSERIKERLLREQDLTLDKALHTCRADEEEAVKSMDDDAADTHTFIEIQVQECVPIRLKVDTGAQANILPWRYYKTLQNRPTLKRTSVRLISYTGDTLPTIGQCDLHIKDQCLEFFIVNTDQSPILGLKASQTLGLIKVVLNINRIEDIVTCYKGVFQGLGCLQQPYHIEIDSSVQPVVCPVRNQPIALRGRLKEELDKMEELKHKTKKLRICLNPWPLNKAIQRKHFQLPTLEDIANRLSGATVFSTLDANHGYWQIPLD
eukprot:Em1020g3a